MKIGVKNRADAAEFAENFAVFGNAYEAAVNAGTPSEQAAAEGARLLCSKTVKKRIAAAVAQKAQCPAAEGLRRIAFGRVNDAVRLAFADDITPAMIERADLFAVAEIKRDRGGKVEMKFFDRQKALEKLIDCEREESGAAGAENLISAIYGNVSGNGKGEEL
ncbi:terminase small subunit [Ruminococcus sp. 210702-SL.1.03]|uniref:terminase small subunit n=1 Tax=Ruminococcus sp. 210702-SL.1.03 TaxID=2883233 RepID=UPI001D076F19|nr:terminase small subunit [Ruminococcus sp. 210702-SL.1.03]MCB6616718.1 terminase small subunit [Ruminococcus sp. 210702-SL.1.03]